MYCVGISGRSIVLGGSYIVLPLRTPTETLGSGQLFGRATNYIEILEVLYEQTEGDGWAHAILNRALSTVVRALAFITACGSLRRSRPLGDPGCLTVSLNLMP